MRRKYPDYLDWVRTLDCAVCCVRGPSEAHHLKGDFHQSGIGIKSPDHLAMPVCRNCHASIHMAVEGWKETQREALIRTLIQAFEDGMIFMDGIDDPIPTRPLETKDKT